MHVKLLQLCPTLCNPLDCSPPGFRDSLVAQMVKYLPVMQETQVRSLDREDLEKKMATHSSILAWRIP